MHRRQHRQAGGLIVPIGTSFYARNVAPALAMTAPIAAPQNSSRISSIIAGFPFLASRSHGGEIVGGGVAHAGPDLAVLYVLGLYMTAGCGASAPASAHASSARQSSEAPFAPSSGTMT